MNQVRKRKYKEVFSMKYLYFFLYLTMITTPILAENQNLKTKETLTELLAKLVSFKTVTSDQEANREALKWVEEELKEYPLKITNREHEGYPSLLITTKETKKPKLWLVAHIDVVPASDNLFIPTVEDGKLIGRGAMDMKMAIASYILLIKELNESLPSYDFGIMLTSDEEVGGENGIQYLLNQGFSAQIAFDPDAGYDWHIEEEAKGVLHLKVMVGGVSAHASRPWEGENAVEKMQEILTKIKNLYPEGEKPDIADFPTLSVTVVQGGTKTNIIPDYAESQIDIRYPPKFTAREILKKINEITEHYSDVSLEEMVSGSPLKSNLNNPYFQLFKTIAKDKYNIDIKAIKSHGASDARFFGEKGIPVLLIAPKGGNIHSDHEWINLSDLVRFYEVTKEWVKQVSHTNNND